MAWPTTLPEWLAWREQNVSREIRPGLARISAAWSAINASSTLSLGTVLSVAGTNGKGTAVHYLERVYSLGGYRAAAYFSPEMCDYQERVRWLGDDLSAEHWLTAFPLVADVVASYQLTLFEFDTLLALTAIGLQAPDITLLEVGMGGRLDAVNVVDADAALVTTIGLDHTEFLGSDRESIAQEKFGIGRQGRPLFCADPQPPSNVLALAEAIGADFYAVNAPQSIPALPSDLGIPNTLAPTTAAAIAALVTQLGAQHPLPDSCLATGFAQPGLPGRLQVVPANQDQPLLILDVAHNPDSAERLVEFLQKGLPARHIQKVHWVVGMLKDKPIDQTLIALSQLSKCSAMQSAWYFCGLSDDSRGADQDFWQKYWSDNHAFGLSDWSRSMWRTPVEGYNAALEKIAVTGGLSSECIIVTGSFRTVASIWCPMRKV